MAGAALLEYADMVERKTRLSQEQVPLREWGFESLYRHHLKYDNTLRTIDVLEFVMSDILIKCSICGKAAKFFVTIADCSKQYKFGACPRCEEHAKRAERSFKRVEVLPLDDPKVQQRLQSNF